MSTRINRLISQINTNMELLKLQYQEKELMYRINYYDKPQQTDPYRHKLEQRTVKLNRLVNKLQS